MRKPAANSQNEKFFKAAMDAMRQAARNARREARIHRTRLILWENGRIVAKKP